MAQGSADYMDSVAFREAQNNGYDSGQNGELSLRILDSGSDGTVLAVNLEQDADTFFSRVLFSKQKIRIGAYAEAVVSDVGGQFCVRRQDILDTHR